MTIIALNLTPYMAPANRFPEIKAYARAVDAAVTSGRLSGPFTSSCPECGSDFSDTDEAYEDNEHIILALASDTYAVVVACEGYYVINPNLVGIDSANWQGPELPADTMAVIEQHDRDFNGCNG
jgi:hypothetical protein